MTRNNKGFSLVELMVVVAIIGILATIAIPKINTYMARARQTEAKTNLASIYTSNKAFYAEYNIYDTHLITIGYRPEGKLRYNTGFSDGLAGCSATLHEYGFTGNVTAETSSKAICGVSGTLDPNKGCTVLNDGNHDVVGSSFTCSTPRAAFTAGAIGKIGATSGVLDQWTMSENKELSNTNDGTQ